MMRKLWTLAAVLTLALVLIACYVAFGRSWDDPLAQTHALIFCGIFIVGVYCAVRAIDHLLS